MPVVILMAQEVERVSRKKRKRQRLAATKKSLRQTNRRGKDAFAVALLSERFHANEAGPGDPYGF